MNASSAIISFSFLASLSSALPGRVRSEAAMARPAVARCGGFPLIRPFLSCFETPPPIARPGSPARDCPPCPLLRSARLIRPVLGRLQLLDVLRRQLRPINLDGQLVELAGEAERHL